MSKSNKLTALFSAVRMLFAEMKSVSTDKGALYYEDDVLAEGVAVYQDGGAAPDGEYTTDNQVITVVNGKVSSIRDNEPKEEPAPASGEEPVSDDPAEPKEDLAEEEPKAEEPQQPAPEPEKPAFDLQPIYDALRSLEDRIIACEAQIKDFNNAPEGTVPQDNYSATPSKLDEYGSGLEAIKLMKEKMRVK